MSFRFQMESYVEKYKESQKSELKLKKEKIRKKKKINELLINETAQSCRRRTCF